MTAAATPMGFADPLAAALWEARTTRQPLSRLSWRELSEARAASVAEELYAALGRTGRRCIGAKIAAADAATQAFLGASGPLVAPLFDDILLTPGATVLLEGLMSPLLEAEIGMRVTDGGVEHLPCIEIAESRFIDGKPAIEYVTADYGGQGRMMFGAPGAVDARVSVTVTLNGEEVARGEREVADAEAMFALARSQQNLPPGTYVATGTLFAPPPLRAGRWELDFGSLGSLELDVR